MINLNPGTLGVVRADVRAAMLAFREIEGFPLGSYEQGRAAMDSVRAAITARWPSRHHVALTRGTTATMDSLVMALAASGPHVVLCSDHEHEGGIAGFVNHPAFKVVALDDDALDPLQLVAAITRERATILFLSQRTWTTGASLPLLELFRAARKAEPRIWIINDAAQAVGLGPITFTHTDLVVASAHKWLGGPRGTGMLWANTRALALRGAWAGHPVSPMARGSVFEPAGGQDFAVWAGLLPAVLAPDVPFSATVHAEVIAQALAARFPSALFARDRMWSMYPQTEGPVVVVRLDRDTDPYPIYSRWNAAGLYTKCVKGPSPCGFSRNQIRIGVGADITSEQVERACAIIAA